MLSQDKKKPHRIKWAEAERALRIRGVVLPTNVTPHTPRITPTIADPSKVKASLHNPPC